MTFRSIRWRLALSFAGIALVATIVLGAVLVVILQNYYSNQELAYLRGNARAVSGLVMGMMSSNTPHDEVQSQIENLAFLSQTRIQVYGLQEQLLYDSGSPQNIDINLGVQKEIVTQNNGGLPGGLLNILSVRRVSRAAPGQMPVSSAAPEADSVFISGSVQASPSPLGGFYLFNSSVPSNGDRSSLIVVASLTDPQKANELGSVKLSEGPAYGREVLRNVVWGWALASAIAILLAAAIGWYISRRISAPILALTDVTAHMAQGDLSGRANVKSRDELGKLARSFNEMADQVETTVTTLRSFVSDAAHELRTPLTALRTNLDLALEEHKPTRRAVFIERAQTMVKRLEELNTNLLDLSRLEATVPAATELIVDLTELLRARSEIYASQAEQAGLVYEAELPPAHVLIRADRSQITRAMDNLMDNACKFTAQDGIVHIALSERGGQAIFSVVDTGIGIPANDLPQLFNRFHRGRNTMSYPGSGLGLAIVNAIVTAHGGQVEVQSAGEGKGSKFSFRWPVVPPQNM